MMLRDFPFEEMGFSEEEWWDIPRPYRCIIRDWCLFDGNEGMIVEWEGYQSDSSIRFADNCYHLSKRPKASFSMDTIFQI